MKNLVKYLIIALLLLGNVTTVSSQDADKVFQKAMMKEEGEGNLTEAIEIYSQLAEDASVDRAIRANALLHIGICNEKLGKRNALDVYQKIISEFSDQQGVVSLARKKLQLLKRNTNVKSSAGLISERLEKRINQNYWLYNFSPDGRYYLYLNSENNTEELMICDSKLGKRDSLTAGNRTGYGFDNTQPWGAKWSPDGQKIAYNWGFWGHGPEGKKIREIHLMDNNGNNKKVVLSGKEGEIPNLEGFTYDGKNLLGTLLIDENDQKTQQLVLISIDDNTFKVLKNFGKYQASNFSFSSDGKYLLYSKSQLNSEKNKDIYVLSMNDMKETQISKNNTNDWNPFWNYNGSQILFLSNRFGTNDLCKIYFDNETQNRKPQVIKSNLGDAPRIMGISDDNSVYYEVENSRSDLFTIDLDEKFNNNINKKTQITNPANKIGGGNARYSKDGRFISYMTQNPDPLNSAEEEIDLNLGNKYYINIYDTKTKTTKTLNIDLYFNHKGWQYKWYTPSWSYHENKLLVNGMIRDNYEGGFFTVDVLTEKITPILTATNGKTGGDYKIFGNSMIFSKKDKDKIYYSSNDWKDLMEYNMVTKEEKSIVHIEDGFWFQGFLDEEETKCVAYNRFGKFISDVNTKETEKIGERDGGWHVGTSVDNKYEYYFKNKTKSLKRICTDGSEADKEIYFDDYFQGNTSYDMNDKRNPLKNEILLEVRVSSGAEIYKLTNVFE